MLYRSIWLSEADFIKIMDLLTEDGSKFDDFSSENHLQSDSLRHVRVMNPQGSSKRGLTSFRGVGPRTPGPSLTRYPARYV